MTQFVGTGKEPQYPKGQPFDIPDADIEQQKIIEQRGLGERVELVGQTGPPDPAKRAVEIADAAIRGDQLYHPQDQAIADSLSEDEKRAIDAEHRPQAGEQAAGEVEAAVAEHPSKEGDAANQPKAGTSGQADNADKD